MGSLDIKSDQKVSEQEPEVANNESESMVDSSSTFDENDLLELISESTSASDRDANELLLHSPTFNEEKASCSSSTSSSEFMLEEPFQDSGYSHGEKTNKGIDYAIESPAIQMMERISPTTQNYRIPSSVFARKESYSNGWGMPSNESLFSIHMGGMSFRNQDSINWRSDELDLGFGMEPSPSGNAGMIPELDETCESDTSEENLELDKAHKDHEFVEEGRHHKLGEEDKIQSLSEISNTHGSQVASEPMNSNSEGDQDDQGSKFAIEELNSHFSAENVGSRSSFAFPILTADTEPRLDTQPQSEPQPEPATVKQTEPSEPKADPPAASWTNCFGCCTSCS